MILSRREIRRRSQSIGTARSRRAPEPDPRSIRFAGDSGDGMQLTGTSSRAPPPRMGNDIATFPDFPAEIRAPAGLAAGRQRLSGQLHHETSTRPGTRPDVLVAMNPAALKANIADLPAAASWSSTPTRSTRTRKGGYETNPLEDGTLAGYRVSSSGDQPDARGTAANGSTRQQSTAARTCSRSGLMYWLYTRSMEPTLHWLDEKVRQEPGGRRRNKTALKAGYILRRDDRLFASTLPRAAGDDEAGGRYRNISGNAAMALGLVSGAEAPGA